jgi:plasmid stability protein
VRRTQIYLDEQVDEQFRQRAAAEGRSAAAVIREALDSDLARTSTTTRRKDPIRAMIGSTSGRRLDTTS